MPALPRFGSRAPKPAALVLGVALAATTAACGSGTGGQALRAVPANLPPGQSQHALLPSAAESFDGGAGGWAAGPGATAGWTSSQGHQSPGALRVRLTAGTGSALSPTVHVNGGQRYTTDVWVQGAAGHPTVTVGILFLNASGTTVNPTLTAQPAKARSGWQRLFPAVGFAPAGASQARVVVTVKGAAGNAVTIDDASADLIAGSAAPIVGPLRTVGNDIVDAIGQRVVLRGIEVVGLQSFPQASLDTVITQVKAAHAWGANFVRVALNPDYLLSTPCTDSTYLNKILQVVTTANSFGMLAELDLDMFSLRNCQHPWLITLPDERGVQFWQQIATQFKGFPLVAFDLYNEPHGVTDRIWRDGGTVSSGGLRYLGVGMQRLYDTVRATGATNLAIVSGTNWATAFPKTVRIIGGSNLVYAAHDYTCPNGLPSQVKGAQCYRSQGGPGGIHDATGILRRFAAVEQTTPVIVDEFGWPGAGDARFDQSLISYVDRHGWSGYCAFTFDGTTKGLFNLVRNVGVVQQPVVRGMAIMNGLAAN